MLSLEDIGATVSGALSSPYVVAMVVPLAFYMVGAFSKKIIRDGDGKYFFALSDWYLAPDALLVTVGSMLEQLTELLAKFDRDNHHGKIRGTIVLLALSVCFYVVVLALHKHYENAEKNSARTRFVALVLVANLLALVVMTMWLLAVKGVDNA